MGVLGGFTTFSAFGNETINLWREGESGLALLNIAVSERSGGGARSFAAYWLLHGRIDDAIADFEFVFIGGDFT